jgi:hypothetical protein
MYFRSAVLQHISEVSFPSARHRGVRPSEAIIASSWTRPRACSSEYFTTPPRTCPNSIQLHVTPVGPLKSCRISSILCVCEYLSDLRKMSQAQSPVILIAAIAIANPLWMNGHDRPARNSAAENAMAPTGKYHQASSRKAAGLSIGTIDNAAAAMAATKILSLVVMAEPGASSLDRSAHKKMVRGETPTSCELTSDQSLRSH